MFINTQRTKGVVGKVWGSFSILFTVPNGIKMITSLLIECELGRRSHINTEVVRITITVVAKTTKILVMIIITYMYLFGT